MNNYFYDKVLPSTINGVEAENIIFTLCVQKVLQRNDNQNATTLEIGVLNGERCSHFLNIHPNVKHIGIDPIIPDSMESSLIGNEAIIFNNTKFAGDRFTFIKDYCENPKVYNSIDDKSVDFLFIDGDHNYHAVERDFNLYFNKVKNNGYIGIHDSRMYRNGANFHPGPSKFVDKLLLDNFNNNIKLVAEAFSLTVFEKIV